MKLKMWLVIFLTVTLIAGCTDKLAPSEAPKADGTQQGSKTQAEIWTCTMHPSVRELKAGKCPICGMNLVPAEKTAGQPQPGTPSPSPKN